MNTNFIRKSLKFKSVHFAATAEVHEVREKENEVDVLLCPKDGHDYIETGWNLQHTIWGFERGEYKSIENEKSFGV